MGRLKLLDLFCGAGGAGMGYYRAGFDVFGVDNDPKPLRHYPFPHACGDALAYLTEHGHEYDAIHASPPCQAYTYVGNHSRAAGKIYPDLVEEVRRRLQRFAGPWVIENTPGAPLDVTLLLCGTMFDPPLCLRRHRIFESNVALGAPQWACRHRLFSPTIPIYEHGRMRLASTHRAHGANVTRGAASAMGIDWMIRAELTQAIPPAYTEYIGTHLLRAIALRQHPDMTEEKHD